MAETAELAPLLFSEQLVEARYVPVDSIPEVASARLAARSEAYEVIEHNRQHLRDGNFGEVSIPVDALGTARHVTLNSRIYGEDSPEATESFAGLLLDSARLLGEAARKNTYEYFSPVLQTRDTETGRYFSHGQAISHMTEKGLTPVAEAEELDRRVNEHVEEATYEAIGGLCLEATVKVRTISECTDWAKASYLRNPNGSHGGYVPEINKFMVRDVTFDPLTRDRYEEQMGLSGDYIDHEVITETLRRRGLRKEGLTKTELHGAQLFADDDMIDFVADLDEVASEIHGLEIFLGEILPEGQVKDYAHVREEAEKRRERLAPKPLELAEFIMELEEEGTDEWLALGMVEARVKSILFEVVKADPSQAAVIFDEETAIGLQEVAYLCSMGLMDEAQTRLSEVEAQAPAPGYCGAGSCGLEAVNLLSESGKEIAKKLKAEKGDKILKDKERSCKCGSKSVFYAYNSGKVNKYCESCHAFESKQTTAKAA
ncbi:MAG TPA: hypothetical protein VLE69_02845 [Candidatus Saccharimonadales bacterium]|nr:hypothetical protein [Candidatus Saccharimonadales bacterium]